MGVKTDFSGLNEHFLNGSMAKLFTASYPGCFQVTLAVGDLVEEV